MNEEIAQKELTPFDFIGNVRDESKLNIDDGIDYQSSNDDENTIEDTEIGVDNVDNKMGDSVGTDSTGSFESENDTDDENEKEDYTVEVTGNLVKYTAEVLKSRGGLPDDFEISDNITEEELEDSYAKYKEETLRNSIRDEEIKRMEDEGITENMIREMKLKYYGVQDEEIQKIDTLNYLSSYKFNPNSESFENDSETFLQTYYSLKGFNKNRIDKLVESDMLDDNIIDIIEDAQKELRAEYNKLYSEIEERAESVRLESERKRNDVVEKANNLLSSGVIGGISYSKDEMELVRRALFDKTEIVLGNDGRRYKTTLYNKMLIETSQDMEKDLQSKINFILGSNNSIVKDRERAKTTKGILNKLNDYIEVKKIKPSKFKENNIDRKAIN